jgi:hypothetical protein
MEVDHGKYAFSPGDYGTPKELALIRLLDFFNILGHNWQRGVVDIEDIAPTTLGYAAVRLHMNQDVTQYLRQIEVWDDERYVAGVGFGYFRELAVALANYPATSRRDSAWFRTIARLRRAKYTRGLSVGFKARMTVPRRVASTADDVVPPESAHSSATDAAVDQRGDQSSK